MEATRAQPHFPPIRELVHRALGARALARPAAALGLVLAAGVLAGCGGGGDERSEPARPTQPGASTPAAAPIVPSHARPDAFLTARCEPAAWARGARIGVGVARPTRVIAGPGPEADAFAGVVRCLRELQPAGGRPLLRTQLPIDALRRVPPGVHEAAELHAFAQLLQGAGADGVISIRSHDFTRCGRGGAPSARERRRLEAGEALAPCEYPSPALYRELFAELQAALAQAAPDAGLWWTAWNEPDHPAFTLVDRFGTLGAARQAGRYWQQAARVVGADRVLGGDFADRSPQLLGRLATAFREGAGQAPAAWAIHPYRDLTRGIAVDDEIAGDGGAAGTDGAGGAAANCGPSSTATPQGGPQNAAPGDASANCAPPSTTTPQDGPQNATPGRGSANCGPSSTATPQGGPQNAPPGDGSANCAPSSTATPQDGPQNAAPGGGGDEAPGGAGAARLAAADAFRARVAPAQLWLNEVTPLLSSRRGIGGDSAAQRAAGERLRAHATEQPVVVALYLLIPPPPPTGPDDDRWDSALADRQGRARPFICGLAQIPAEACAGSPDAYGG